MADGSPYKNVTTVNGNGETVKMEGTNGMISWMCNTHSSFDGAVSDGDSPMSIVEIILVPIRNIIFKIANLFQRLFGFV